jgi:hypothetical protein
MGSTINKKRWVEGGKGEKSNVKDITTRHSGGSTLREEVGGGHGEYIQRLVILQVNYEHKRQLWLALAPLWWWISSYRRTGRH